MGCYPTSCPLGVATERALRLGQHTPDESLPVSGSPHRRATEQPLATGCGEPERQHLLKGYAVSHKYHNICVVCGKRIPLGLTYCGNTCRQIASGKLRPVSIAEVLGGKR